MAEWTIELFKTRAVPHHIVALATNGSPWCGLDDLEIATCRWDSWFSDEQIHGELGDRSPAEVPRTALTSLSPMRHE